jgi:hypothetical protein
MEVDWQKEAAGSIQIFLKRHFSCFLNLFTKTKILSWPLRQQTVSFLQILENTLFVFVEKPLHI